MSKKILSLALAVVMLFSICAVAVSAVDGDGTENISIIVTSDAEVGAPAGTIVKVSYALDLPVDELQMCVGNVAIGWNNAAYRINSDQTTNAADARTWGEDFGQYMKSTSAVTVSSAISTNILKKANANDTAKGFNQACQVQMVYDGTNATSSTGFPVKDGEVIFTLEFVALRTLTANDVIGVVEGAFSDGSNGTFFKVCYFDGTKIGTYTAANINMTQAAGAPSAPSYDVFNLKGSTGAVADKHANGDGTYTVAVFYGFDFDPQFNTAGTSQFISAIAATVTATSGGQSVTLDSDPIKYVWQVGEGYGFRVILKNVPADADISIVPSVTTDGTAYKVETVSFNVTEAADA